MVQNHDSVTSRSGRVGYVPGVFDMFHVGHVNILSRAREHCDHLIAGVVSDEKALAAKGRAPVVPLLERMELLQHCRLVDEVVAEAVQSKLEMWQKLRFHVLFKGDDWRGTPKGDELEATFREVGVEIVYFPYTVHTSSTLLRGALERVVAS
nr:MULTISPECIES: adenylyltransferase/cytidyltransferase family protein [unclassified Ornithinimicrobium]